MAQKKDSQIVSGSTNLDSRSSKSFVPRNAVTCAHPSPNRSAPKGFETRPGNPYQYHMDLTSKKLASMGQLSKEEQNKRFKDFKAGTLREDGSAVVTEEQKRIILRNRCLPTKGEVVQNADQIRSPFLRKKTPANYIKAQLVNNSLYHAEFDPTLVDHQNLAIARVMLGPQQTNNLAPQSDQFDKRYHQRYPKWREKQKKQVQMQKKTFRQQCRALYTGRRMKLENALTEMRQDRTDKELLGFFNRDMILDGKVPYPAEAEQIDNAKMAEFLEEYRDKLFPCHKLEDFLPPCDISNEDVLKLMERTGRIKQGEKVYEPFAEYLKQRAIYESKFGEWKTKKEQMRQSHSPEMHRVAKVDSSIVRIDETQRREPHVRSVMSFPSSSGRQHDSIGNDCNVESELAVEFSETIAQNTVNELKRPSHPSFMVNSILKTDCTLIQESQQRRTQQHMFSKNFENTSREEVVANDNKRRKVGSSHVHSVMSDHAGNDAFDQPALTLSSTRAAPRELTATQQDQRRKKCFKLPRRSKLPQQHELRNRISPKVSNENMKRFAQMKVPFMTRNKVLSRRSFCNSNQGGSGGISPFSPDQSQDDRYESSAMPQTQTKADSNYMSRGSVFASNQRRGRCAPQRGSIQPAAVRKSIGTVFSGEGMHEQAIAMQRPKTKQGRVAPAMRLSMQESQAQPDQMTSFFGASSAQSMKRVGTSVPQQVRIDAMSQSYNQSQMPHLAAAASSSQMLNSFGARHQSQAFEHVSVASPKFEQNYRNVSLNQRGQNNKNRLQEETFMQLDCLMNECNDIVPNLIGKIREVRTTNNHMILPKGYTTQELIGKDEAQDWSAQLKLNSSIIEVLDRSKLNEEVDMMLAQQKIQARNEKAKAENVDKSLTPRDTTISQSNRPQANELVIEEEVDDMPAIIKPLPKLDSPTASIAQPLEALIEDMTKEDNITYENFEKKESMRKYERDDYKVKAFLMLIKAGKKHKMWMPGKTQFDKRGGKFSERVSGLGQIPGLH